MLSSKKVNFSNTMIEVFEETRKKEGVEKAFVMVGNKNQNAIEYFGKNVDTFAKIPPKISNRDTQNQVYFEWDNMPPFMDADWQNDQQTSFTRIINILGRGIPNTNSK